MYKKLNLFWPLGNKSFLILLWINIELFPKICKDFNQIKVNKKVYVYKHISFAYRIKLSADFDVNRFPKQYLFTITLDYMQNQCLSRMQPVWLQYFFS